MNDKVATAFLMTLAGAIVIGILYIAFVPIPELAAGNPRDAAEAERIKATVACIEQSGAAKERDLQAGWPQGSEMCGANPLRALAGAIEEGRPGLVRA